MACTQIGTLPTLCHFQSFMHLILTMILEFCEMLLPNLQALETMGKIKDVNGYVRMTLDKMEKQSEKIWYIQMTIGRIGNFHIC